jgi:hypothetical protein
MMPTLGLKNNVLGGAQKHSGRPRESTMIKPKSGHPVNLFDDKSESRGTSMRGDDMVSVLDGEIE